MLSFTDKRITFLILDSEEISKGFDPLASPDDSDNMTGKTMLSKKILNMILEEKVMKREKLHRC
jgi:hypothetical protein